MSDKLYLPFSSVQVMVPTSCQNPKTMEKTFTIIGLDFSILLVKMKAKQATCVESSIDLKEQQVSQPHSCGIFSAKVWEAVFLCKLSSWNRLSLKDFQGLMLRMVILSYRDFRQESGCHFHRTSIGNMIYIFIWDLSGESSNLRTVHFLCL